MCTRFIYQGENENIITARSMDWKFEMSAALWIFPRGAKRDGRAGKNSLKWVSKYGSVGVSSMGVTISDGVNEKGLVANILWLVESSYTKLEEKDKPLALSLWAQYILDNFKTVEEMVEELTANPLAVVTANVPGQNRSANVHLAISDKTGDSAIIEYIDGKQVIYHSKKYQVMTNSPIYSKQLAINEYWENIGGLNMVPGGNRSSDRFVRASFYVNTIPQNLTGYEAVGTVLSVLRSVSVPLGFTTDESPEISSTRWRTLFDHKHNLYFFDSVLSPNVIWTDLNKIDFSSETGKIKRIHLGEKQMSVFNGEVNDIYEESEPLKFLEVIVENK